MYFKNLQLNKTWLVKITILVIAYFLTAKLGLLMAFKETNASPVWPPTGLALAAILLWRYKIWPGIFIGAFLVNAVTFIENGLPATTSILMSCGIGIGNTLEAVVGAYLILQFARYRDPFLKSQDILKFICFAVVLATVVSATIGITSIYIGGVLTSSECYYTWFTWWFGNAVGNLIIAPVILAWFKEGSIYWNLRRLLSLGLVTILLLLVLFITFGIPVWQNLVVLNKLEYLVIPIVVCSCFLFGRVGSTNFVLFTGITAVMFTVNGKGPFVMNELNDSLLSLQIYLAVLAVMSLFLVGILTERKKAKEAIIDLNQILEQRVIERTADVAKLSQAIKYSSATIMITDTEGNIEYVNPIFTQLTGYSIEDVIGKNSNILKSGNTPLETYEGLWGIINSGKEWRGELSNRKKNGNLYWESLSISPVINDNDVIINFIAVKNDITEQKKILQEKQKISAQLQAGIEQMPAGYILWDKKFHVLEWNSAAELIFGYTKSEVLGTYAANEIVPEDKRHQVGEVLEHLQGGTVASFSETNNNIRKDGKLISCQWHNTPLTDDSGSVIAIISIVEDITHKIEMEETIHRSEKLKSIGTITAGISHEFNNILAIISGTVQLLEATTNGNKELSDALRTIKKASDDGAEISSNMLKFTKTNQDTENLISSDIRDLVRHSIDFTKPRWKNEAQARGIGYTIDMEGMKGVSPITCKPAEIREVFINIINNALDAMPGGGSISFSVQSADNTVLVNITDTGEGMSEDVKKNIFDPFFSTKGVEGTGLGMSIVYGIVARHGGKIEVDSEIGRGTTFMMQFPTTNKRANLIETPEPEQETSKKNLHILVIDDEEAILNILNQFLSRDGHTVKTVDNGADAINMIEGENFDLVLCDLAMPNVFGYDVVNALDGFKKRPKIGIVTGWSDDHVSANNMKVDFYLRKPFKHSELTKHINEAFDTNGG